MEQLMTEVRAFAAQHKIEPTTVVQRAGCGSGGTWARWEDGRSCTLHTADKLRAYMAAHPADTQCIQPACEGQTT